MELENLTLDFLKETFKTANTNGTFKMWAKSYIRRTYNLDAQAADCVFDTITNELC